MIPTLTVVYQAPGDLAAHLAEHADQGALLLRVPSPGPAVAQFDPITLNLRLPGGGRAVVAEVLQVIPGLGLALRLTHPAEAKALCEGAAPSAPPTPPAVTLGEPRPKVMGPRVARGSGVRQWPMEKVLSDWNQISFRDKVQLARRGKRAVRRHILRQKDKKLQKFVLQNPELTADEMATIVALPGLDPTLLRKIAASPEWTRHAIVARALICHPKMALPQVQQLISRVPEMELRRLTRTGRVRSSVKRLIIRAPGRGRETPTVARSPAKGKTRGR